MSSTVYHFCTYFDSNYLLRGLTMYRSLRATGISFRLHVLALDEQAYASLMRLELEDLVVVPLIAVETWAPRLLEAKSNRGLVEYYFTLSPAFPLFLLEQDAQIDSITYLDADLFFYHSPAVVFEEMGQASILITEHRYPPNLLDHEKFGRYNVQYQSYRNDGIGVRCLRRWHEQCLDWCYDRIEDGKYADQKYLEEWPGLYGNALVVSSNRAVGVAPWNWSTSSLDLADGEVRAAGMPIVFYHFHGVRVYSPFFISNGLLDWGLMPWRMRRWFYAGYIRDLRRTARWLSETIGTNVRFRDNTKRGKGIGLDTLGEVARKAWAQAMFVP